MNIEMNKMASDSSRSSDETPERESPTDNNASSGDAKSDANEMDAKSDANEMDAKQDNVEIKPILIKSRFRVDKCDVERLDGVDSDMFEKSGAKENQEMLDAEMDAKNVRFMLNPKDLKRLDILPPNQMKNRLLSRAPSSDAILRKKAKEGKRNKIITIVCFILFITYFSFGIFTFKQMNQRQIDQLITANDITKLSDLLPGVTICSKNFMNLKKLKKSNQDLVDALELISHLNATDEVKRYESKQILKEMTRKYLDSGSISDFQQLTLDSVDFIEEIFCNLKWIKKSERDKLFGCSNLIRTNFIKRGATCFNLFNAKSIIASNHDHFDSDKFADRESIYFMLGIPRNEKTFDSNQLIEITLDFKPQLIADPYIAESPSGEITFHPNRFIPSGSGSAFTIKPGYIYNFYIQKEKIFHSDWGQFANCTDYQAEYLKHANETADYRVNHHMPTSREGCLDHCISKSILERCRCWSPSLPFINYYTNFNTNHNFNRTMNHHGTIFWCNSILNSICEYSVTRRACLLSCPADCMGEIYHVDVDTVPHPNERIMKELEEDIKFDTNPEERKRLQARLVSMKEYLKSKAVIKVYMKPEQIDTLIKDIQRPLSVSVVILVLLAFNSALVLLLLWITKD